MMARTCGNPGCKCTRGEKHVSLYLSTRVTDEKGKSKRKMIYISPEWEERLRTWVNNYKRSEELIEGISAETLKRFLVAKVEAAEKNSAPRTDS